jgi:hypothetical protein
MSTGYAGRSHRYLDRARSYGRAAATLASTGMVKEARLPFFMLVAHAAELALKAVIAGGGFDDERLITLGHDLTLCMRLANDQGLDLEQSGAEIEAVVGALAMPHLAQTLRYPAYLSWPLPDPRQALEALTSLLSRVEDFVGTLSAR